MSSERISQDSHSSWMLRFMCSESNQLSQTQSMSPNTALLKRPGRKKQLVHHEFCSNNFPWLFKCVVLLYVTGNVSFELWKSWDIRWISSVILRTLTGLLLWETRNSMWSWKLGCRCAFEGECSCQSLFSQYCYNKTPNLFLAVANSVSAKSRSFSVFEIIKLAL